MSKARLKEVTEFVLDGTHGSPVRTEAGVPVLSAQNVKGGRLDFETNRYTSVAEYDGFRKRLSLAVGDVLLTIVGTIGRAAVVDEMRPLVFQRSVAVVRPRHGYLCPRFLYHVSQSREFQDQLSRASNQSSQAGVYLGKLKALEIPLPSFSEQRRIAEILDKADALRAKRRAALARFDTLTQSIFLDMFGDPTLNPKAWPKETIGEIAEQVTDGEHLTPRRTTTGIKLLSARNVRDGYLDFENVDYIGADEYERISRRCDPSAGDVLISCSGTIGRVASVETAEKFSLVRSAALIRPNASRVGQKFLEHYLRTPALKARMLRRANASSQANLFQGQIRELPVYVPPLGLQREFACQVLAVQRLRSCHRASLSELDALFASLQHRAFRGEL
ncbi:restriction endonuclease subunit S [Accumulibacter sp.]|uniref:restriction endonuclease subunit S n=1 Tax=Accumulibacter sp. TaxID=2053492 RepID=UPI0028C39CFA|nr:restriction endonuclease subunit S [Accumulibacter sp.]